MTRVAADDTQSNDTKTFNGQMENLGTLFGVPTILTREKNAEQFSGFSNDHVHTVETVELWQGCIHCVRKDSIRDSNDPDALAVLLFTSGSTGHSKAVEFTHRQLLRSVQAKQKQHTLDEDVNFMSWISFDHSANFCELHLNAMNVGANQISVNASDFVHEPHRFYEILSRRKIGYTFSPNSFLATASKAWMQEDRRGQNYDFSNLKVVMVGGEANRVSTMEAANDILTKNGASSNPIKAAYGLSEVRVFPSWLSCLSLVSPALLNKRVLFDVSLMFFLDMLSMLLQYAHTGVGSPTP